MVNIAWRNKETDKQIFIRYGEIFDDGTDQWKIEILHTSNAIVVTNNSGDDKFIPSTDVLYQLFVNLVKD